MASEEAEKRDLDESSSAPPAPREGKRARKAAETFRPESFESKEPQVKIYKGTGERLGGIDVIQETIESLKPSSPELLATHKFLYTYRGKVPKKELKNQVLEFSGFKRAAASKDDEEEIEAFNQDMEKKMTAKAYKLKVSEIKTICDVLDIDRSSAHVDGKSKALGKEELVEKLLDFVEEPKTENTKTFLKKAQKKTVKKPKTNKEYEIEAFVKGQMPNDKALRQWVKAYVACFDHDSATTKHAVQTASDKFGVDLTDKKDLIKEMLAEEL